MIGIDTSFLVAFEIAEHPGHDEARETAVRHSGESLALAPQVLTEFLHVATDPRRFARPVSMHDALRRAQAWWNAAETERVLPAADAVRLFLEWMSEFELGSKRLLDTMLAATYRAAGVSVVASTNARDFAVYPGVHPLAIRG